MRTDLDITVTAQSPAWDRFDGPRRPGHPGDAPVTWKQVAEADWSTYRVRSGEAETGRGALIDVAA